MTWLEKIDDMIASETRKTINEKGSYASTHEGLAVIMEEFEELKKEVFSKNPDKSKLLHEAVQIASSARVFAFCFGGIPPDSEEAI